MKHSDILALVDAITPGIDASFSKAIAPLLQRLNDAETLALELGERLKVFEDRKPVSAESVAADVIREMDQLVPRAVADAIAAFPVPKDGLPGEKGLDGAPGKDGIDGKNGIDGKDGAPGEKGLDGKDGAPGEDGADGKDVDAETLKGLVAEVSKDLVLMLPVAPTAEEVAALIPVPVNGKDGAPGLDGKDGLPGLDGKDGLPGINGEKGLDGKDGVSLKDLVILQSGILAATFSDGATKQIGKVVGDDGAPGLDGKDGAPGLDGKDGAPGADVVIEDVVRLIQNEVQKQVLAPLAEAYKGVWKPGSYNRGDAVTWNGSLFIANADTDKKPEDGDGGWKLAVKRGRDGKDVAEIKALAKVRL